MTSPETDSSQVLRVEHSADVAAAGEAAAGVAARQGLGSVAVEECRLVALELGSNLVRHAGGGELSLRPLQSGARLGVELDSLDAGPGIRDVDRALRDGFSTGGSLGYGLGAVARLCEELSISSPAPSGRGTRVLCRYWQAEPPSASEPLLEVGVASRPYPGAKVNGDAFFSCRWSEGSLVGVLDGLGHGPHAHQASTRARHFIERRPWAPLPALLAGVDRECRTTRGVVLGLARLDHADPTRLHFAGIGNIEMRLVGPGFSRRVVSRRGTLGVGIPRPLILTEEWGADHLLVLHSDGLTSSWSADEVLGGRWKLAAQDLAGHLLEHLVRGRDDATVLVARLRSSS